MRDGLVILLAFLLILKCALDWIQLKDELREMRGDEEDEQGEDDSTGTIGSYKGKDL